MTQIILIRHGETLWNQQGRMQGQSDSPLSETGVRQEHQFAQRLKKIAFNMLYSSNSGRARRTARSVSDATSHDITVEPRLRERYFGVFEGLTGTAIKLHHPGEYARAKGRDPDYVTPGGESALQVRGRDWLPPVSSRGAMPTRCW
jgi:probable phosphoglycerate mutase